MTHILEIIPVPSDSTSLVIVPILLIGIAFFAGWWKGRKDGREETVYLIGAPNPEFLENCCMSYDHSFGLMSEEEKRRIRFYGREWMRAIRNNSDKIKAK